MSYSPLPVLFSSHPPLGLCGVPRATFRTSSTSPRQQETPMWEFNTEIRTYYTAVHLPTPSLAVGRNKLQGYIVSSSTSTKINTQNIMASFSRCCTGCRCPGAGGGLQDSLCEEPPCQTGPFPTHPPQGMAGPSKQDGGTSGKVFVRTSKTLPRSDG